MDMQKIDSLGVAMAQKAMLAFVKLWPDCKGTSTEVLQAACDAMKAEAKAAVSEFLADSKDAPPYLAELAFRSAVLSLASAGIKAAKAAKACEVA